jgi:protein PhnA
MTGLQATRNRFWRNGIGGPVAREGFVAMAGDEDAFVYDQASGEWISAADAAAKEASSDVVEVRDSVGNLLADGDQVTLIKDLTVKGAGQTLKRGTLIKSIRLTGDAQEIDCRYDGIKGLVLRAEFVRKR